MEAVNRSANDAGALSVGCNAELRVVSDPDEVAQMVVAAHKRQLRETGR